MWKGWEELRLVGYDDGGGVPTAGWGHTAGVKIGETYTLEQAEQWLRDDVEDAATIVDQNVVPALAQYEFDALTLFVGNVGHGRADPNGRDGFVILRNGKPSTMLRRLNERNFFAAAEEFNKWNKQGNRILRGLIKRRAAERRLFEMDDYTSRP